MVIGDIIVNNKDLYPERIGVIDEYAKLTWKEVNNRVNQLANTLLSFGLLKGDVVAMMSENNHVCVEFFFAVAKAGLVGVMINYRLSANQIQHVLNDCKAKVLIAQDKFIDIIDGIRPDLNDVKIFIGTGGPQRCPYDYENLLSQNLPSEPKIEIDESDLMWINYTGGTSGLPKGATSTHKSRFDNCILHDMISQLSPGDVAMLDVPVCAYAGLQNLSGLAFASATMVIIPFSPERFARMAEQEKVSFTIMHLARYKAIREYCESSERKHDFSSLRRVAISGGEGASRKQIVEMLGFFGARLTRKVYGGTEMGIVTFLTYEDMSAGLAPDATEKEKRRLDSVGKPCMGYRIKILDEEGHEVPIGQRGEIVVKGPNMMSSYLNLPKLSEEVFRGEPGWYYTKDLGVFDDDGYLYFLGRKDFMVKTGGFNVFPGEVESAALTHPAIAQAAMFGVPDDRWTNVVHLAVVLKPGCRVSEEEIIKHCRKQLAGYQTPKEVHIMEKLPVDQSSSKVLVKELGSIFGKKGG